ncbi:diguanylate cyclase (GGDEF) domain-containing protein [Granulicella pectinivorans]|uniref:diguanylate cyclase n=1 Tax=Granulicella pectinivorans TaxID=474950 RepID=A0A1I6MQ96_9BACT|nr:GGDEF domain-containing protein [Granulicella pectinivorans]SFS17862.1 diguanylate cyclase (GGDEF) domain-containing protein [Granulicella pectinivorans]
MTNPNLDPASGSLASLLAAMDCVALEVSGYDVRIVSAIPPWLDALSEADPRAVEVVSLLPFLEVFLNEAVAFWAGGSLGRLQSDFWTQTNSSNEEVHLLAFAAVIDGRQLIVIRSANDLYEERQRWQLYAHQTAIQLQLIERLKGELEKSSAALQAANDRLSELSIRDGLTGLYNRRHFDQTFQLELNRSMRTGEPLSVLFMDIDKFKVLNDTYGHSVGDDCLRAVAKVLADTVRRPTDMVARFGGEEFAVLLPATEAADAFLIATTINKAVRALDFPNKNSEVGPYVTASLGAYTRQPDGYRTMAQILESVDAALYRAKKEGRNRVIVATKLERLNDTHSGS